MLTVVLVIIHVLIALVLTAIVLLQQGRQQGLSGAIAGGAETFFGKNKGRTIDAMLKKFTAVFAILFILSSIVLTYVSIRQANFSDEAAISEEEGQSMNVTMDENGNLVDENGNIVISAEDMQAAADSEEAAGAEGVEADAADVEAGAADSEADDTAADDAATDAETSEAE